jgi:aspartate-semialdehyde dehydrogenase
LVDNPASNHFPMPIEASGQRDVLVGRVRLDPSHEKGMNMFVCGDQLLKGAALNAVQIALNLLQEGRISERVTGRPTAAESAP